MNFLDTRLPARFWDKCIPEPNSGCWLWLGARMAKSGYGKISWVGRVLAAHRVAYQIANGPIAPSLECDHLCRTRCCVNPAHIEPVPHKTNVRRGVAGDAQAARTHCPAGHAYDAGNTLVLVRRGGVTYRRCLECSRGQWRSSKRRSRAR